MGGGSRKTTETTKSDPYSGLPEWAQQYYRDDMAMAQGGIQAATDIRDFLAENPRAIEGISGEEFMALEKILQGEQDALASLEDARDMIGGEQFMSAYTDDVVDTTLAGIQRAADRERAARGASEAAIGGLSGTRGAVADMLAGESTARTLAETEAALRDQAHRFGVEAGFQGAGTLADLAGQEFSTTQAGAGALGAFGALGREQRQQQADEIRTAGQQAQDWWTNIFGATRQPPATGSTSGTATTVAPKPSALSQIAGAAATAAGIWSKISDERTKENIEVSGDAIEKLRRIPSYDYDYRDDFKPLVYADGERPTRTSGLMAQDIERSGITGAVREIDGVKVVDPYPVLATVVQAVRELDQRTQPGQGL